MITPAYAITATERVLPRLALDWTTGAVQPGVDVVRAGVATYIDSNGILQNATADTQRIDYSTGTAGLLVEESRTNLLTYSENFADASWNINTTMGVASGVADPWGGTTAFTLTANGASSVFGKTISGTSGIAYSGSIWVRRRTGTGTIALRIGDNTSIFITSAVSSNWTRIIRTATPTTTTVRFFIGLVTSGDEIDIWGSQLEANSFGTSYIPTEASQVTRNADVATMTGTNFSDWYSAGAGGVVARVLPSTVSGTRPVLQFDDTTADEVITLRGSTTNPELVIVDGGAPQAQIDAGTIAANTAYNLGAAWDTDNCAAAVNGGAAVTDTTATIPTVTQARLGSDGTNYLNGQIQTVRYWPQRIINAEVQAFSK
jgi:hypothetical protein